MAMAIAEPAEGDLVLPRGEEITDHCLLQEHSEMDKGSGET